MAAKTVLVLPGSDGALNVAVTRELREGGHTVRDTRNLSAAEVEAGTEPSLWDAAQECTHAVAVCPIHESTEAVMWLLKLAGVAVHICHETRPIPAASRYRSVGVDDRHGTKEATKTAIDV